MRQPAIVQPVSAPPINGNGASLRAKYSSEEFANRKEVLDEIRVRIVQGQEGTDIRQSVLLALGIHGMGKSWLLRHVEHDYASREQAGRRKGTVTALADFSLFEPGAGALAELLGEMVNAIKQRLPPDAAVNYPEFETFYQTHAEVPAADDEQVARRFVALIDALAQHYVPILLFDAVDRLEAQYYEFFNWFEEWVLAPLVRWDHTLVILASRRELRRLRQFEVRRRLKKLSLQAFTRDFTIQQVKKVGSDEGIGELLYPITYGHPLTTRYVWDSLERVRKHDQPFDQVFLDNNTPKLIDLLDDVESWLLTDASPELRPTLIALATLRYFHIRSLQLFLRKIDDDTGWLDRSDAELQSLIGQLADTNLVRWSMQHHAYEVETTIRHLLGQLVMRRDKTEFIRRHEAAIELYSAWIEEIPWNSDRYIIEVAYHLDAIIRAKPERKAEALDKLQGILNWLFEKKQHDLDLERADTILQNVSQDEELRLFEGPCLKHLQEWLIGLKHDFST